MSELKDFGLQYVNPNLVEVTPPVRSDWETTKDGGGGTSRDVIRSGLANSGDVRAKLDQGYSQEDFDNLRHSSDPQEKAIGDSHSMFWGDDPITVNKNGDQFSIDRGGRHRIDAAQADGTRSLPMRVYAPDDDPEFSQRDYDHARTHGSAEPLKESSVNEGRSEHNPVETPEVSKSPEVSHVDPMDPQQHEQFDAATAQQGHDPMDGSQPNKDAGVNDNMNGGEKISKPAESASKDIPEIDAPGVGG